MTAQLIAARRPQLPGLFARDESFFEQVMGLADVAVDLFGDRLRAPQDFIRVGGLVVLGVRPGDSILLVGFHFLVGFHSPLVITARLKAGEAQSAHRILYTILNVFATNVVGPRSAMRFLKMQLL